MLIKDKQFEVYISSEEIAATIDELAKKINDEYGNNEVIFLGVLNGAFMFAADLLKKIDLKCQISFVKVASYQGTSSSGEVHELIGLVTDLKDKHVVILEDIVDTGLTLSKLYSMIEHDQPKSLAVATFLFKPDAFNGKIKPKYVGRTIPDRFVVGYGLDYDGFGRNTDSIYILKED